MCFVLSRIVVVVVSNHREHYVYYTVKGPSHFMYEIVLICWLDFIIKRNIRSSIKFFLFVYSIITLVADVDRTWFFSSHSRVFRLQNTKILILCAPIFPLNYISLEREIRLESQMSLLFLSFEFLLLSNNQHVSLCLIRNESVYNK